MDFLSASDGSNLTRNPSARSVLNVDPANRKAKLCKIICKIHLGQYEEALKEIAKPQNDDIR